MDPDAAAFTEFVRGQVAGMARLARLLTGDRHDAEDLVQVVLSRVATRWEQIDDPAAYARRTLYTQAVSRWRRLGRRAAERLTDAVPEPASVPAGDPETRLVLSAALRRLTPRQRAVLVLRYYEDRTEAETAELLGVALGTVKSQTRHALRRLRVLAPELAELVAHADTAEEVVTR